MFTITIEKVGHRIHLRSPYREDIPDRVKTISGYSWAKKAKVWTWPCDFEVCRALRAEFGEELTIGPELWEWATVWVNRNKAIQEAKSTYTPPLLSRELSPRNKPFERKNRNPYARAYVRPRVRTSQISTRKSIARPDVSREGRGGVLESALNSRPYQWAGVNFLTAAREALLADQPGVGKTVETLGALRYGGVAGKVLIVAPSTSCSATWEPEISKWLEPGEFTILNAAGKTPAKRKELLDEYVARPKTDVLDFLIVNPEILRYVIREEPVVELNEDGEEVPVLDEDENPVTHPVDRSPNPQLFDVQWDAIVGDESHKYLINTNGKSASQTGLGFANLKTAPWGCKYVLSGTPLKGKIHNIWGTLNFLRPEIYTTKWGWVGRYFELEDNGYGQSIMGLRKDKTDDFHRELDSFMFRRTKTELRKQNPDWMPPEKEYHDVWVEMTPKQAKSYAEMKKTAEVKLEGGTTPAIGVLAEFTRLKQLAGCHGRTEWVEKRDPETGELRTDPTIVPQLPSAKLDWLIEFLEERGISKELSTEKDEIRKVVVASQFTQLIEVWNKELNRLGIKTFMLTGKTKDRHRAQNQALFQDRKQTEVRVFLINTNAGGVSITLDAADDIVIMDETWVPDEQEQVEDRVHRASDVKHQVDVWYVRTRNSIEEYIAKVSGSKSYSNHLALDSQRGLAYARSLGWEPPEGK